MKNVTFFIFFSCLIQPGQILAQEVIKQLVEVDTMLREIKIIPGSDKRDLVELIRAGLKLKPHSLDPIKGGGVGPFVSALPGAGYAIQSGYIGVLTVTLIGNLL